MEFTESKAWKILAQALKDLEDNKDIIRKTAPEYIIGYLLKSLHNEGLLENKKS